MSHDAHGTPNGPTMSPARVRAGQWCVLLLAAAPLAVLLVLWAVTDWSTLPDRLATHFGPGGQADGFSSPGAALATALVATGVGTAVAVLGAFRTSWHTVMRRTLAGAGAGFAWLLTLVFVTMLGSNTGHHDPASVQSGAGDVVWPLLAGLAAGVVAALLTPASPATAGRTVVDPEDLPHTELRPGERPVLTAGVGRTSPFIWIVTVAVVVLAAVLDVVAQSTAGAVIALVVGVLVLATTYGMELQVDGRGARVRLFGLPWPIARADLADIVSAEATDLSPARWGGWGYRITPHGRAIILRGGAGVVLHLADGSHLAVSTDSAQQAAALVNGLLTSSGR